MNKSSVWLRDKTDTDSTKKKKRKKKRPKLKSKKTLLKHNELHTHRQLFNKAVSLFKLIKENTFHAGLGGGEGGGRRGGGGGGVSTQAAVSTGSANLPVTRLVLLAPRGLALG